MVSCPASMDAERTGQELKTGPDMATLEDHDQATRVSFVLVSSLTCLTLMFLSGRNRG